MGHVYRSRDTRLGREVAIKVLSAEMSGLADVRERFDREAHAVSRLNHPNICTLHDVGDAPNPAPAAGQPPTVRFLVMEFLEGETLAARLQRSALPLKEALRIAIEIGEGLETAHRHGIVHRDLKPANVMLTTTGTTHPNVVQAKLLDFGLARLGAANGAAAVPVMVSAMPTDVKSLTSVGTILGTLQYMAPEQLQGQESDARSDIFAFGTVLYEMFTGRRAFDGKSQVSVIAAILEHDPPSVSSVQRIVPSLIDEIVSGCLAKNPVERWQTVTDVVKLLRWASSEVANRSAAPTPVKAVSMRERLGWATALGAVVIAAGVLALRSLQLLPQAPVVRFQVPPPTGGIFPGANLTPRMAVSPDGQQLAFTVNLRDGKPEQLWVRRLDSLEARPLLNTGAPPDATEPTQQPFWSPDSRYIGFFSDSRLKKVDVTSGTVITLASIAGNQFGGTWNQEGTILFGTAATKGIQRVSAEGGGASQVTELDSERGETSHLWPRFLPDGRHFLYVASVTTVSSEERDVYLAAVDSAEKKLLFKSTHMVEFAAPHHLLYVRDNALMAQRFDLDALELEGEPVPIAENVQRALNGRAGFTASATGVLVYSQSVTTAGADSELVWLDREGKPVGAVGGAAAYRGVELSPDGLRVAIHLETDAGGDVHVLDLERAAKQQFTFTPVQQNMSPVWSRDGTRIMFSRNDGSSWGIYDKDSAGVGDERLLFEVKNADVSQFVVTPRSALADRLLFTIRDPKSLADIWQLPLSGERQAIPYVRGQFNEDNAQISPDGRWVAYSEGGGSGAGQVFVREFPSARTRYQVSTGGGTQPRWRSDGRELFYLTPPASAAGYGRLMSVGVEPVGEHALRVDLPQTLFDSGAVLAGPDLHISPAYVYAVDRHGKRFLVARQLTADGANPREVPLTVVMNWPALLPEQNRR